MWNVRCKQFLIWHLSMAKANSIKRVLCDYPCCKQKNYSAQHTKGLVRVSTVSSLHKAQKYTICSTEPIHCFVMIPHTKNGSLHECCVPLMFALDVIHKSTTTLLCTLQEKWVYTTNIIYKSCGLCTFENI